MKKKKNSALKKLVPATCMLLVSATMLASSTYAWFTMSREVEVNNIKLTATVPDDMQLSFGALDGVTKGSGNGLGQNYGTLAYQGTSADNGGVLAPDATAEFWSNSADASAYYEFGKIMPASSTNGADIFFTPDASGVGKTLKAGATYYQAADLAGAKNDTTSGDSYEVLAHAITSNQKSGATVSTNHTFTAATGWGDTNEDGYFVDIPVWIRTSSKSNVDLYVDAYVSSPAVNDSDDLYQAARVVILKGDRSASSGLVEIKKDSFSDSTSIVDFMATTNAAGEAVKSVSSGVATYNTDAHYNGTTPVVTVIAAGANEQYSAGTKCWIRVWLEGEDPNCWNANAGQDFNICVKFQEETVTPATNSFSGSTVANNAVGSLKPGDTVAITGNQSGLTYEYDGATWNRLPGSFVLPKLGQEYTAELTGGSVVGITIQTEAELISWLTTNVTTKEEADTGVTLTAVDQTHPTKIGVTVTNASSSPAYAYTVTAFDTACATATQFTVNGVVCASKTELETALAAFGDGSYEITVTYS